MKNRPFYFALLTALLPFFTVNIYAQAPEVKWLKNFGGYNDEYAYDIQQTSDSGYIIAGSSNSLGSGDVTINKGGYDAWVVKLSDTGSVQWQKALGGGADDAAVMVRQSFDKGYIVAGNSASWDGDVTGAHGDKDVWIVKLSDTGGIQWQKAFGGSGSDGAMSICQTSDSGYIVVGWSASNDGDVSGNHGGNDFWVLKISATGSVVWQKTYGGSADDYATSVQITNDGYVVAGYSGSTNGDVSGSHGGDDFWIVKISTTGALQWQKSLGGTGSDFAERIIQTADLGYAIIGGSNSANGDVSGSKGNGDIWVVKLSASGTLQWQKCFGGSSQDAGTAIRQTEAGDYVISGWVESGDGDVSGFSGRTDFWLAKISSTGSIVWQKTMGNLNIDVGRCVEFTSDSGYIYAGYSFWGTLGGLDMTVIKLNTPIVTDVVGVSNDAVYSCVPNPTTGLVTIKGAKVDRIRVYDILGQLKKEASETDSVSIAELSAGRYIIHEFDEQEQVIYSGKLEKW